MDLSIQIRLALRKALTVKTDLYRSKFEATCYRAESHSHLITGPELGDSSNLKTIPPRRSAGQKETLRGEKSQRNAHDPRRRQASNTLAQKFDSNRSTTHDAMWMFTKSEIFPSSSRRRTLLPQKTKQNLMRNADLVNDTKTQNLYKYRIDNAYRDSKAAAIRKDIEREAKELAEEAGADAEYKDGDDTGPLAPRCSSNCYTQTAATASQQS